MDNRYRDANGEISRRHGDTQIKMLRRIYGVAFAPGFRPSAQLSDALEMLDDQSLTKLIQDHEAGTLGGKIEASVFEGANQLLRTNVG